MPHLRIALIPYGSLYNDRPSMSGQRNAVYTQRNRKHKRELGLLERYKYIDDNGIYTGSHPCHI